MNAGKKAGQKKGWTEKRLDRKKAGQKKGWTEKRLDERLSWRPLRVRASNHSNSDNFRKIFLLHFIELHSSGSPHNAIALL